MKFTTISENDPKRTKPKLATMRYPGDHTGRLLKDERLGELPAQESTKVEPIINLKTAKPLRLTVPLSLLGRADEVIEKSLLLRSTPASLSQLVPRSMSCYHW